jgi:hypothetical protein
VRRESGTGHLSKPVPDLGNETRRHTGEAGEELRRLKRRPLPGEHELEQALHHLVRVELELVEQEGVGRHRGDVVRRPRRRRVRALVIIVVVVVTVVGGVVVGLKVLNADVTAGPVSIVGRATPAPTATEGGLP